MSTRLYDHPNYEPQFDPSESSDEYSETKSLGLNVSAVSLRAFTAKALPFSELLCGRWRTCPDE
jgi:hypothetical protein